MVPRLVVNGMTCGIGHTLVSDPTSLLPRLFRTPHGELKTSYTSRSSSFSLTLEPESQVNQPVSFFSQPFKVE